MLEICDCCFYRPTARNWPRSSEFGNWPGAWRRTTATSQRFPKCSKRSPPASIAGADRTKCCAAYAALLKTLCLASEKVERKRRARAQHHLRPRYASSPEGHAESRLLL